MEIELPSISVELQVIACMAIHGSHSPWYETAGSPIPNPRGRLGGTDRVSIAPRDNLISEPNDCVHRVEWLLIACMAINGN